MSNSEQYHTGIKNYYNRICKKKLSITQCIVVLDNMPTKTARIFQIQMSLPYFQLPQYPIYYGIYQVTLSLLIMGKLNYKHSLANNAKNIAQYQLYIGGDINRVSMNSVVYFSHCRNGHLNIAIYLIEKHRVHVKATSISNDTPLHLASECVVYSQLQ